MQIMEFQRHAGPQAIGLILVGIQRDTHGNALHYFDVIAGRVFRRNGAGYRASGPADRFDGTLKIAIERVYVNHRALSRPHIQELRLFEVCSDPEVADFRDRK